MRTAEITKQDWVDKYAGRVLALWRILEGPLGIDETYKEQLQKQLSEYFDEPLKRNLIESTY